ncbi:MAG: DUF393 domain-containing protein [Deltaproteobacteria bacterium]|nr:DUF393 domain-containing protein [Deltaproteobacteria bacterium]
MKGPILLFDGYCNFCNGWVDFIIRRDPKKRIHFAPLQSEAAEILLRQIEAPASGADSVLLVWKDCCYTKSSAILRIFWFLRGLWPLVSLLFLIPPFLRNLLYDWIAGNRYKWFGKRASCRVPTPEVRERFI